MKNLLLTDRTTRKIREVLRSQEGRNVHLEAKGKDRQVEKGASSFTFLKHVLQLD